MAALKYIDDMPATMPVIVEPAVQAAFKPVRDAATPTASKPNPAHVSAFMLDKQFAGLAAVFLSCGELSLEFSPKFEGLALKVKSGRSLSGSKLDKLHLHVEAASSTVTEWRSAGNQRCAGKRRSIQFRNQYIAKPSTNAKGRTIRPNFNSGIMMPDSTAM